MNFGRIENDHTNYDFEEIPSEINLSGVSWENRQNVVNQINEQTELLLVRDYNNQYDKNAIAVKLKNDVQVGWIPKKTAEIMAPEIDAGVNWEAKFSSILGNEETQLKGVLIKLFI
ncbi:HIRAN domain protein [compost metagenome]